MTHLRPLIARALPAAALLVLALGLTTGCSVFERLGMGLVFEATPWPEAMVSEDVTYVRGQAASAEKQRLDFFEPWGEDWPTLIFVHGGSWMEGDKDLTFGGQEVYGNIGRYYASRGVAVAVISYRLQPEVGWREQVDDVAAAVGWVASHAGERGGDPGSIFLAGHSAGAQLASFVALADWPLEKYGLAPDRLCGVVAISGAGYDLADERTYELGADLDFYRETFTRGEAEEEAQQWQRRASALAHLEAGAPPFLVFFAEKEHDVLQHQAHLLHDAATEAGVPSRLIEIANVGHKRIVVAFSQRGDGLDEAVVDFVETHRRCREGARDGEAASP